MLGKLVLVGLVQRCDVGETVLRDPRVRAPDLGGSANLLDRQGVERVRCAGSCFGRQCFLPDVGVMFAVTGSHFDGAACTRR